MKKFLILMSAGVAFAFASCATKSDCCGSCQGGNCAKTECATCAAGGKTCAACAAKKN